MRRRHRHHPRISIALVAGALALPLAGVAAAEPQGTADVIVVLHDGVDARAAAHDLARDHDARVGHVYEHALSGFSAEVPEGRLSGLERDPRVDYVDENQVVHAVVDESPTGIRRIDADDVHKAASPVTGTGVRVAVIDTGIDLTHPDLETNIDAVSGKNCIDTAKSADDDQGHGTHVAGTIAAEDDGSGVVGVAPGAKLVPIKVLDAEGSGTWDQIICGIDRITALNVDGNTGNDVDVANMSLGGATNATAGNCSNQGEDSLLQAICASIAKGTAYTVAAGNDSKDAATFLPAAYPDVITVSAFSDTDGAGTKAACTGFALWATCDEVFASFSNYGSIVDVIAPGVDILSTDMSGGTSVKSGTSMAAPHVAGVAALALATHPGLNPAELEAHLRDRGQCPDGLENAGTGDCAGTWADDPDGVAEPMVNAVYATSTTVSTAPTGPIAPSDLTATARSYSAIDLTWKDNSTDETGFRIERSPDGGTTWIDAETIPSTSGSAVGDPIAYNDAGLQANTTYHYRVSAVRNEESGPVYSDPSNVAQAKTMKQTRGGGGKPPR